jgi:hypothetical protein
MAKSKKTGGRKKGSRNKSTVAKELAAENSRHLRIIGDPSVDDHRRDEAAKAAMSFVHPRLATTSFTGDSQKPIQTVLRI